MHASNWWHICCNSGEESEKDTRESTDLASSNPPDIHFTITSSLAIRDAISLALAILS